MRGVRMLFRNKKIEDIGGAERFRLRNLAYALDSWNQNTGSLSRLEIDPLPHQIHLVHHILASGNLNWLIADDVGLGKTIEVGMLLAALKHRGYCRRVLLVTPAGLVRQWQEELYHKFQMTDFQIYGVDFNVNKTEHWKLHDHVIASMDQLKGDAHLESVLQAPPWDIVVFDEAHRLSRRQWVGKLESTERYRLAAALRQRTDSLLLLTATPHQGMQDKFQALLELLRPDLRPEIQSLSFNPEILRDLVVRNSKADVTDVDGNFLFKGKVTRAVEVSLGPEEVAFDRELQKYLRRGYSASQRGGKKAIPIGFVMTVYRKLSASSIAAILAALERRLERLRTGKASLISAGAVLDDERFAGEQDEMALSNPEAAEFFAGEIDLLETLIITARKVYATDRKLDAFLNRILTAVNEYQPDAKLVIFTEYRATQDHIVSALRSRFGDQSVVTIHGSLSYAEREQSITSFEDTARFLVSTEAGGEGVNLHRQCHIMINYDLPWNPMRLVQRIGRLYRYGQTKNVVIFNLHAPQSLDAQVMNLLYSRINAVIADMAPVGEEFRDGLQDEILGELVGMLDVDQILQEAADYGISRTAERISEALDRAKAAVDKQRTLFEHASGFDPTETDDRLNVTSEHASAFVDGMLEILGIEIVERVHGGRTLELRLPEAVQAAYGSARRRLRITFDRDLAQLREELEMMDFQSPFFQFLAKTATQHDFGGHCAAIYAEKAVAVATVALRWQSDQGARMREEFTAVEIGADGKARVSSSEFSNWLLHPAMDAKVPVSQGDPKQVLEQVERIVDARLASVSNRYLHPENRQWRCAAWVAESTRVSGGDSG
jgi:superfamily II DNA or RNA helicase